MMKLYTEEQVREAFDKGYKYAQKVRPASIEFHYQYVEGEINSLKPIELPSDDEIDLYSNAVYPDFVWEAEGAMIRKLAFSNGAKWVIEQIKQQDNDKI